MPPTPIRLRRAAACNCSCAVAAVLDFIEALLHPASPTLRNQLCVAGRVRALSGKGSGVIGLSGGLICSLPDPLLRG
jgi:hypothetical protein